MSSELIFVVRLDVETSFLNVVQPLSQLAFFFFFFFRQSFYALALYVWLLVSISLCVSPSAFC